MIFRLETGYFIWNLYAWAAVFLLSTAVVCGAVYAIYSITGGRLLNEKDIVPKKDGWLDETAEHSASSFMDKTVAAWAKLPFCHMLMIAALTLLFMSALFSSLRME